MFLLRWLSTTGASPAVSSVALSRPCSLTNVQPIQALFSFKATLPSRKSSMNVEHQFFPGYFISIPPSPIVICSGLRVLTLTHASPPPPSPPHCFHSDRLMDSLIMKNPSTPSGNYPAASSLNCPRPPPHTSSTKNPFQILEKTLVLLNIRTTNQQALRSL